MQSLEDSDSKYHLIITNDTNNKENKKHTNKRKTTGIDEEICVKKMKHLPHPLPSKSDFECWGIIEKIYLDIFDGFDISKEEEVETSGKEFRLLDGFGSATYGEVKQSSGPYVRQLLEIKKEDVFFDIGSGVGKLLIQMAISTPCKKAIGVELSESRYEASIQALDNLKKLKEEGCIKNNCEIIFKNEDVLDTDLSEATTIMYSNVCFPPSITEKLLAKMAFTVAPGTKILTLKKLCARCGYICKAKGKYCAFWRLIKEATLKCTWTSSCSAYVYEKWL